MPCLPSGHEEEAEDYEFCMDRVNSFKQYLHENDSHETTVKELIEGYSALSQEGARLLTVRGVKCMLREARIFAGTPEEFEEYRRSNASVDPRTRHEVSGCRSLVEKWTEEETEAERMFGYMDDNWEGTARRDYSSWIVQGTPYPTNANWDDDDENSWARLS